jgi:vitamin B12 transporter
MGGVINVITKRGQEGIAGKAELGFGSFGRFDQKLSLSGAGGGFDFSLGVTNSSRNDYKTGDGVTWPNSEYDQKTGLDLDVGYTFLERHRLSAHLNYNLAKGDATPSGFSDTWNFPDNVTVYDNSSYNATIMYEGGTDNELLNWKAAYTFGRTTSNSVGYIEDDPNNPLVINWYLFGPFYPEANTVYNTRINFHQAQAQLSFDNGFLALIGGFDHVRYRGSSESLGFDIGYSWTTYGRDKAEDTAGYLLAKVRPFGDESLILSAAGRYDSYEVSTEGFKSAEKSFTPSVGVAWSPLDWLKLRAHYAEGFIVPTPANLFGDTYYLPNLDVKPAKSKTWEVGVDVAWNYVDASLTYFHTNYKDKIVTVMVSPAVNGKTRIYDNLDAAIIAGLELSLGVDLGAALQQDFMLRPYASLTYLTTRENKNRNRRTDFVTQAPDLLPDTPKLTAAFGLTFEHPGINLASTLSAAYMGRRYTMDFSAAHAVAGGYFDNPWVETGGFTVWNLSLEKRLWGFEDRGSLGLRVELNNIFDKDYAYSLDYPLPGRNFYVGLSIEY